MRDLPLLSQAPLGSKRGGVLYALMLAHVILPSSLSVGLFGVYGPENPSLHSLSSSDSISWDVLGRL